MTDKKKLSEKGNENNMKIEKHSMLMRKVQNVVSS